MAEQYIPGPRRIFYKTTGLIPLVVGVSLFDSELNNLLDKEELNEAKDNNSEVVIKGLYYFDYTFYEGIYIAYFRENGVERGVQVYNIRDDSRGGFRPFLGDNVINT